LTYDERKFMKMKFDNNKPDLSTLWFVKLRWIAISAFLMFLLVAKVGFDMPIFLIPNLIVLFSLILINLTTSIYIQKIKNSTRTFFISQGQLNIIQIIIDLILLSIILHYSGSIENPFIAVYLLHIVLAAIILPIRESFIITIIANLLLGSLVILEYKEIIPHYQPIGFESYNLYQNINFILLTGLVFAIMSFVILYFTSSITKQLRENQIKLNELLNQFLEKDQNNYKYILNLLINIKSRYNTIVTGNVNLKSASSNTIPVSLQKSYEFSSFLDKLKKLTELRLNNSLEKEKISFKELLIDILNLLRNGDLLIPPSENITDNFYTAAMKLKLNLSDGIERNIPLTYAIDKNLKTIYGNKESLQIMIYQILHNAIKFNSASGQIYFKAKAINNKLRIEIYDTGRGIIKNEQHKVFEDFFKGNPDGNFNEDASGLGLTLVNEIVKKHSGRIWLDSKKGKGTKFNLELPILATDN
jgi:signal transduction histidine kinase